MGSWEHDKAGMIGTVRWLVDRVNVIGEGIWEHYEVVTRLRWPDGYGPVTVVVCRSGHDPNTWIVNDRGGAFRRLTDRGNLDEGSVRGLIEWSARIHTLGIVDDGTDTPKIGGRVKATNFRTVIARTALASLTARLFEGVE